MKIGFVGTFPRHENSPMSGPRRVSLNLAKALAAIDGLDLDVFAYGLVGGGIMQKLFGGPVHHERFGIRIWTLGYLALPIYARRYDILYFAGGPFHAVLSVLAAKILPHYPKIVYSAGGVIRKERKLHAGEETRAPYWKEFLEGLVIKNADSVVCLSPLCADTVVEEWGIPRSKTAVVPLGVENTFGVAEGWAKPDASPLNIMTISKVHRCKGLEFLLLALKQLKGFDFCLYIVSTGGSKVYRQHLDSIINASDGLLAGRVKFVGPCGTDELKEHFASSCVYVQASEHETFCLAVLEAMSAGLPVVVTQTTGMSYLLKDGVNGYVVPFGDVGTLADRLRALLRDAALRKKMSGVNIARARELSWDASARLLLQHFAALGVKSRTRG